MKAKTLCRKFVFILVLVCGIDTAGVLITNIPYYCPGLPAEFPPDTAGMVFFRGFDATGRFLSPDTLRRANKALRLYRAGAIGVIACIGGARPGRDVFGSQVVKDYLVSRGIPDEKVAVDKESYDSRTNWQVVRNLALEHGWNHVTLIASPMHSRRLRSVVAAAPVEHGEIFYSPYSYIDCEPPLSGKELWVDTHYEWLAYIAEFILPESVYSQAVRRLREGFLSKGKEHMSDHHPRVMIPVLGSCFSIRDILYLDCKNELTIKANPSQGGDAKLQGPLTGIASFRINASLYWEKAYLLFEDRFCFLINDKGKPIVRWGRKAIGSWIKDSLVAGKYSHAPILFEDRFFCF